MGLWDGKKGESIFYQVFFSIPEENELPELFRRAESENDRLYSFFLDLVVENRVDRFLKAWLPRVNRLGSRTSLDFKIRLIEAANLIPFRVTLYAALVRQIRNKFAHDFDSESLADLPDDIVGKLSTYALQIKGCKPKTNRERLWAVAFHAVVGLDVFRSNNLEPFMREITSDAFQSSLKQKVVDVGRAKLEALRALSP